ncbi:uncharacterized protein LOC127094961 [Lathyrus oleraceus]|uniref:uncharacterized protein LOC127094961 n=1 Tax=Pisum sativum TaxID=3888 RepID=UPI0021D223EB|nr:uncharacterized protein LOC127094961 [Pisum sativum]
MAPNRTQLQSLAQKPEESFKEYAHRWRGLATRVQPPMLKKEMVYMFMGTLQGPYYKKLVGSTSAGFSDLVVTGERIESGVKAGKIPSPANVSNGTKKPFSGLPKKKEGETNVASTFKGKGKAYRTPYYQVAEVTHNNYQPPTYAISAAQQQAPCQPPVQEARPPPSPLPPGYDANVHCEFHTRAPSHTIDNCKAFQYKVQDLLDSKAISFAPTGPNVNNNRMPPQAGHPVNMIQESAVVDHISKVDMIKTPLLEVKEKFLLRNMFPGCIDDCARCGDTPQGCEKLRKGIQMLVDQGIFLVEPSSVTNEVSTLEIPYYPVQTPVENAPTTPLVITVPTPFPYESTKAVPWNYNSTTYLHGRRLKERTAKAQKTLVSHVPFEVPKPAELQKPVEVQEPVVNITGTSGTTRSGRIFAAPPPPLDKENLGANTKSKDKQPAEPEQGQTQT